jgi:uncharacterized tellurite resistance protein B-like protein
MDILKIFKGDPEGIRKSHVKNLITVAMADGQLESDEWDLLVTIARILGASDNEINDIQNQPEKVTFIKPKKYDERLQQISDLVAVMTIDGHINLREIDLCKKISMKLDILPRMVDDIVSDMAAKNQLVTTA